MMAARYAFAAFASAAIAIAQSTTDDPYYDPVYSSSYSSAAFWTVTARYAEQVTESPYTYYDDSVITDTYTSTRTIKDDVIPTASPYLVTTSRDWYDTDVQIVAAYYATGIVAESDLVPETTYNYHSTATTTSTTTSTRYSMQVTMTAPASCPTPFTITTTASVSIPTQVTAQISPSSTEAGTTTDSYGSVVYKYETWYLTAGAAPFHSSSDYYYEYYIASCSTPPPSRSTGSSSSSGSGSGRSSSYDDDCYYYCGSYLRTYIIVIASVIPALFLLGFLESWFWFRRLMMGRSAMRFGTISWVLISLWILCFTRMQDRRSKEDQKLLAEKWKNMGSGAAFKAWWKWGFRHKYPEELLGQFSKTTVGIVPPGQLLHPEISQTPAAGGPVAPGQVYYYGPPPPGWVQGPNGAFVPPQGYVYPPPQQAGFYGDTTKDGSLVSHSPVSAVGHPPPVHSTHDATHNAPPSAPPSPPPQAPLPTTPAPAPPANVSEAPASTGANQPTAPPPKSDPNNRDLYG